MARANVEKTSLGPRGQSRKEHPGPAPKRKQGASAEKNIGGQCLTPADETSSISRQANAEKIIGVGAGKKSMANAEKKIGTHAETKCLSQATAENTIGASGENIMGVIAGKIIAGPMPKKQLGQKPIKVEWASPGRKIHHLGAI